MQKLSELTKKAFGCMYLLTLRITGKAAALWKLSKKSMYKNVEAACRCCGW